MSAFIGPPAAGTVRSMGLRVTANGIEVPWPVSASVELFNNYRAGTFSVLIATQDSDELNLAWWSSDSQTKIQLAVYFDLDGVASTAPIITGNVDNTEIHLAQNGVTATGRDLSALLIDTKTADMYQNYTSSQIITMLAAAAGLTPVVTDTTTPVGQYYAYDHVRVALGGFSRSLTQWDLATYLAQNEDFDLFVEGSSLYFQPRVSASAAPYQLTWQRSGAGPAQADVVDITPSRSLTIAKGVAVTVKSWNSAQRQPVIQTAGSAGAEGQTYVIYQPNLSIAQALQLAQTRLAQITRFEKKLEIEMPGDLALTPRMVMQLSGTGTPFDQLYYPDEVRRTLSPTEFSQSVTALNHPSVNQTTAVATTGAAGL